MIDLASVFATGLFAGGASCAAVQGGLLAGTVANRRSAQAPVRSLDPSEAQHRVASTGDPRGEQNWALDTIPVLGFLGGKLVSHTILGALLGLVGGALELGSQTRAVTQILAGLVMIALAAHLLGVRAVSRMIPPPPASVTRFIRRRTKSEAPA